MSIIQDIREKYAKISVIAIAVALIGFILTDYISGRGRNLFRGGGSNNVGSVNGKSIPYDAFKKRVDQAETNIRQQPYFQYQNLSPAAVTQTAIEQAWNQEVNRLLFSKEYAKLGMRIEKKERGDMLYGTNAPKFIKDAGTDEKTGAYDPLRARQRVEQMLKDRRTPQSQKDEFNNYLDDLDEYRMNEKYLSLFTNSVNFPRWFIEKQINDNAQIANISMVRVLFTDSMFVDSTIKVSDKEITDYISKRKNDERFKQKKSRSITFVTFSAAPTQADSAEVKKKLLDLRPEFDTVHEVAEFLARNGNPEPPETYYTPAQLPPGGKDSIIKLSKNEVYGPYLEGGSYVMVKMLDSKIFPDSVKARHILIKTFDPQSNQQVLDDSTAKKRIDSIFAAIKGGARFDSLAVKYSDDKGSGANGGLLETPLYENGPTTPYFTKGRMVPEFNDFCFEGKTGDRKVVKTVYGYHLIEILDQKNFQLNYKVGYLAEDISPSKQTDDDAAQNANEFAGENIKDPASFDAAFEKNAAPKGAKKGIATNIGPLDIEVRATTGMTTLSSRTFVSNIYRAKLGEVMKPEKVESNYVVAMVTEINDEGVISASKARPMIEPEIRNQKKAEIVKQKAGQITTLEAAASALGKSIEKVDSIRLSVSASSRNLGFEPKVIGAAFNPANNGKVVGQVISGLNGVYIMRVDNVGTAPSEMGSVADQRKQKYETEKAQQGGAILSQALRQGATIKDKRADKF